MNVLAHMSRSIDAAFDLVARNPRAWSKFDLTVEGFYHSFAAMLIVLPMNIATDLIAVGIVSERQTARGEVTSEQFYGFGDAVFSTLALALQWMIFPIAMLFVLRFLNLTHRYAALIIAHNWGTVVVWLFNLPAFLLYAAGIINADQMLDLNFIVLGFTIYYRFYIAQTALGTGWSTAGAIAFLDLLLQLYFLIGKSHIESLWLPVAT